MVPILTAAIALWAFGLPVPAMADRPLEPPLGLLAEGTLTPGEKGSHTLALPAGHYATLQVERVEADVSVVVESSGGGVVLRVGTLTFPPGPRAFALRAETDETYALTVTVSAGGGATRYRLRVLETRPATAADDARVRAERALRAAEGSRGEGAEGLRQAKGAYESAVSVARESGEAAVEADALTGLARTMDTLGEKSQALDVFARALVLHRSLGRTSASAYVLGYAALVHDQLGARPKAIELLEEALALSRACGDRRVEGLTLNNLALIRYHLGESERALELWTAALDAHTAAGNPRGEATTLTGIGTLYDTTGDKGRALDYLQRALVLRYAVGDKRDLAISLNNIGAVHRSRGDTEASLGYYEKSRQAFHESGDASTEAAAIHNLAQVHEMRGDFQQAIARYHEAIAVFRATESPVREANSRTALANLYAMLGDGARAMVLLEQALPVHRQNGNRIFEAMAAFYMANLLAEGQDRVRASALYEDALRIQKDLRDRRGQAATVRQMARLQLDAGDAARAVALYGDALVLDRANENRHGEATSLAHLALAQAAAGAPADARRSAETALSLARAVGDPQNEAFALYTLAQLERTDDAAAARAHAEEALARVESMRSSMASHELRASFLAGVHDYFALTVDLLMAPHGREPSAPFERAAFEINERARARSLLDRLGEGRADIREGVDPALAGEERRLRLALNAKAFRHARLSAASARTEEGAALGREIDALGAALRDVRDQIRARSPRYALLTQPPALGTAEIAAQLDADTVLLEYALGRERSYLWLVGPDLFRAYTLPPQSEIESLAARFRASVSKDAPVDEEAASALSRILLAPVGDLPAGRRLVIVAEGALQSLPMAALPLGGAPLVARHEVVMLPSASTLALLRSPKPRAASTKTVMVLADPVFDPLDPRVRTARRAASGVASAVDPTRAALDETIERGGLGRLLGSRREAASILSMARAGEGRQAVDFDASRALATGGELARYRIVHFATHGVLDAARPELSGLVLSLVDREGRPDDGFLRMHDIYNLPLAADLVVLSACQSGLGRDVRGEGLVGLTRAFMYAGTPRVVASLWKVDDRATAELMRRFYAAMLGPRAQPPAAALRAAQLEMARDARWHAPYHWAGFVLQGEWR